MIEKIGTEEARYISNPSKEVIEYLEILLKSTSSHPLTVAEIGVGVGATSVEIARRLRAQDSFHFYSFQDEVDELHKDLVDLGCECELIPIGNSRKTYDSYCWPLAKLVLETDANQGVYDLVYLDAGKSINLPGLGCALLKMLIKPGGYLVFDDLRWTYAKSPTLSPSVNPSTRDGYTDEQIDTPQIQMVVDIFMEKDPDWTCAKNTKWRAVYRREKPGLIQRILGRKQ